MAQNAGIYDFNPINAMVNNITARAKRRLKDSEVGN